MGKIGIKPAKNIFTTNIILLLSLFFLILIFSLANKDFYSSGNIVSMLKNASFVGILSCGMTLVLISGEVDLSIGGNIGLTSVIFAYMFTKGFSFLSCILVSLLIGLVIGAINSILVGYLRINAFIATLGVLSVTQGIAYTITNGLGIVVMDEKLLNLSYGKLFFIPIPLIILIVLLIIIYLSLNFTKFGLVLKIIGTNRTVAYLSGLNVVKIKSVCLFINAILASFAGLLITSNSASGMPQNGKGIEMEVLTIVILGGASLEGGEGSILGTALALLILSIIYNGLTISNTPTEVVSMIKGILLLTIVGIYGIRKAREV